MNKRIPGDGTLKDLLKRPVKNWPFSFPALLQAVARGGREARIHLIEMVAHRPQLALPHISELAALLDSTRTPVRVAAIETLASLSHVSPRAMAFLLPKLHALLASEPQSVIVGHAIEILANYGKTSAEATKKVVPILRSLRGSQVVNASKALDELTSKTG